MAALIKAACVNIVRNNRECNMRNFFSSSNMDIRGIQQEILELLPEVISEFNAAYFEKIEKIAQYFDQKQNSLIDQFSDEFLRQVQDTLTPPARVYGYYDNRPESERPGIYRTTSALWYGGDSYKFRDACRTILSSIDHKFADTAVDRPAIA